ncbi:MAG: heme biosynthesis protein HemY [Pseudomonadales bacterium]|nr:heme biosynthesis protein HemY [Pseudomonadales bacterium]NIX06701.1 heme biosynthesis protein HemY [Pseudomonadales bacterium]
MRTGILLIAVAAVLGGLVGTLVVRDPGYVLLAYDDMAVETSLWFALVALVILYFVVRLLVFVFTRLAASGGSVGAWNRQRQSKKARAQTIRGLLLMAEGKWAEGRRLLVLGAPRVDSPLINYLSAARGAHAMGDVEGRDELLRKAHESTPGARFAVGLTQAQLQASAEQWEQCLASLLQLHSESPRHPLVLSMLAECYEALQDWRALTELLPSMRRAKLRDKAQLDELQQRAWHRRLGATTEDLKNLWAQVPKELRRNPDLIALYAERLLAAGLANDAEAAVRSALEHEWRGELVQRYGEIASDDPGRQLIVAEGWLKSRPNDSALLLALGRICLMNEQWAKAREYLEASLRLRHTREVYGELGRLCVAMGDVDRGSEYLKQSVTGLPDLPLPEGGAGAAAGTA